MAAFLKLFSEVRWPLAVPICMIAAGVFLWVSYTRDLAKQHKEFGEKTGVSRSMSEEFHLFIARFFSSVAIVAGTVILAWQLISK